MQKYLLPLAAASLFALATSTAALATPVSAGDLSGKKICWDNGSASVYSANGHYSNNASGEGTWAVTGGGVAVHTDRYDYVADVQKLGGGKFHAEISAGGISLNGSYCK
jgi:hypothetical protein